MKRKIFILSFVMGAIMTLTSCDEWKLQRVVAEANKECPMDIGVGIVTSIELDGKNVVYNIMVSDNEVIDVEALSKVDPDIMKEYFLILFESSSDEEEKEMLADLSELNAGITYKFKDSHTGKVYSISMSPKDVVTAKRNAKNDPDIALKAKIGMENAQCPEYLGDGLVCEKATIEGDYVVYYYVADEEIYSIEAMNEAKLEMKEYIMEELPSDPAAKYTVEMCKKANKGIAYKYIGDTTGEECIIRIRPSEL